MTEIIRIVTNLLQHRTPKSHSNLTGCSGSCKKSPAPADYGSTLYTAHSTHPNFSKIKNINNKTKNGKENFVIKKIYKALLRQLLNNENRAEKHSQSFSAVSSPFNKQGVTGVTRCRTFRVGAGTKKFRYGGSCFYYLE